MATSTTDPVSELMRLADNYARNWSGARDFPCATNERVVDHHREALESYARQLAGQAGEAASNAKFGAAPTSPGIAEDPGCAKPCPFCGGKNIDDEQGETYRWRVACCRDCGARSGEVRTQVTGSGANTRALAEARAEAFAEWNRRAAHPASTQALSEEAKDAARYRFLKQSAIPGERPHASEMSLNYRPIRLRIETAVYSPSMWSDYVDRAIDAAMVGAPPAGAGKEQT